MKILTNLLISLAFLFTQHIYSQLNLPLKFEEDVIKWSELSWTEGQLSKDQWHLVASAPIIDNDTIYFFTNYYQKELEAGKNYGYCGYIIKKLNIKTGEKSWEIKRKYKEFGNRKIISQAKAVQGSIEISLYEESHAIGINTDWNECYPAYITLDKKSGLIIDSNYVDKTRTQLTKLRSFGNLYYGGATRPKIYKNESGYVHLRSWLEEILCSKLDNNGQLVRVDSIKYPVYKFVPWDIKFEQVSNDSFWVVMLNRAQNWTDIQVLFTKYDSNFAIDTTYDVSEHFAYPITQAALYNFDRDYFMVGTQFTDQVAKTEKYTIYLFNHKADFIDSISYTYKPGIDDTIVYARPRPLVDRVNNRLLMTQTRQNSINESTYYEMYENIEDTIRRINKVNVLGIKDHFTPFYSTMMDNGDVLLYVEQLTNLAANGDRWYSWIMLEGKKLNIISNIKDAEIVTNKLKLYPNPTSSIVKISNLELPSIVQISNLNGQMIKQLNNVVQEINISDMPSGMYIFDIRNKEISERHKIVKVE